MLLSKIHDQKGFNVILFSYQIQPCRAYRRFDQSSDHTEAGAVRVSFVMAKLQLGMGARTRMATAPKSLMW